MTESAYSTLPLRPPSPTEVADGQEPLLSGEHDEDTTHSKPPIGSELALPARIRWINFILGAAVLLPWNAIITAMPYFLSRLSGSALQSTFSSYLSATYTVSNFCFLAHATATSRKSNFSRQTRRSLFVLIVLVFLLTISTFTPLPAPLFFSLVLLNGVCQASAGAYLQSAVLALASLFGPTAIQPVMTGQAAVGILVSLVQVLSAGASIHTSRPSTTLGDDESTSAVQAAFLFFGLSTLFLVFAIGSHAWLVSMPVYKAVVLPFEAKKGVIGTDEERETLVGQQRFNERFSREKGRILGVAKMNAEYNIAVAYVFAVTLSVFPPITSSIRSVHLLSSSRLSHPLLFTALHFLIFNIGDFVGRYLPTLKHFQVWSDRRLLYMSLSRTLFIPLFLLCNVQRPSAPPTAVVEGVFINSDILFFLILLIFGITNGWIGTLVLMAASSAENNTHLEQRKEDVDVAATVAQFCLVGGLVIGSFTSFGVRGAICACNPFTT